MLTRIEERMLKRKFWSGPLPPPETIREYQQMIPDAPERVFRQYEKEATHRRTVEKRAQWITAAATLGTLGLAFASRVNSLIANIVAGVAIVAIATIIGLLVKGNRR